MLNVVVLSVVAPQNALMLNFIMLCVVRLNVVAPTKVSSGNLFYVFVLTVLKQFANTSVLYLFFTYLSAPLCRTISAEKEKSNKRSVNAIKPFSLSQTLQTKQLKCLSLEGLLAIEIRLQHTPFVVFVYFFSSFEHAKNC